jgi:hypothetical protein
MNNARASQIYDWIMQLKTKLYPTEEKFLKDINSRLFSNKTITDRQGEVLLDILKNHKGGGR